MKWVVGCVLIVFAVTANVADAAILPSLSDQKWEVNLDGLGELRYNAAEDVFDLYSMVRVSSDFKAQGTFPSGAPFVAGSDTGATGIATNQSFQGVVAQMITDLVVIAVYDSGFGGGSNSLLTSPAAIFTLLTTPGGLGADDVVFFGAKSGATPLAHLYHDSAITTLDGSGAFASQTEYTDSNSREIGTGSANTTQLLAMTFQDISGNYISRQVGSAIVAPTGTLLANSISTDATVRPLAFLDVVAGSGPEAGLVKADGMYFDALNANEADGTKLFVADVIAAVAAQTSPTLGKVTLSDPLEFVSVPEPASVAVWASFACLATVVLRRRRVIS